MASELTQQDHTFAEIAKIIETARSNAYRKVNEELIMMYWKIGRYLSQKSAEADYGDAYIDSVSAYIQKQFPCIKGFTRRGLYRMKQFYETYKENEKVSTLLTQLSWTISPLMVAEYQLKLPDKEVLRKKLRELADLPNSGLPQETDPFQEDK